MSSWFKSLVSKRAATRRASERSTAGSGSGQPENERENGESGEDGRNRASGAKPRRSAALTDPIGPQLEEAWTTYCKRLVSGDDDLKLLRNYISLWNQRWSCWNEELEPGYYDSAHFKVRLDLVPQLTHDIAKRLSILINRFVLNVSQALTHDEAHTPPPGLEYLCLLNILSRYEHNLPILAAADVLKHPLSLAKLATLKLWGSHSRFSTNAFQRWSTYLRCLLGNCFCIISNFTNRHSMWRRFSECSEEERQLLQPEPEQESLYQEAKQLCLKGGILGVVKDNLNNLTMCSLDKPLSGENVPLQLTVVNTLGCVVFHCADAQNRLRDSGLLEMLAERLGWPYNLNDAETRTQANLYNEYQLQLLIVQVLREVIDQNAHNVHRMSELGGFMRLLDHILWVTEAFSLNSASKPAGVFATGSDSDSDSERRAESESNTATASTQHASDSEKTPLPPPTVGSPLSAELTTLFRTLFSMTLRTHGWDGQPLASIEANRPVLQAVLDVFSTEVRANKKNTAVRERIRSEKPEVQFVVLEFLVHMMGSFPMLELCRGLGVWDVLFSSFFFYCPAAADAADEFPEAVQRPRAPGTPAVHPLFRRMRPFVLELVQYVSTMKDYDNTDECGRLLALLETNLYSPSTVLQVAQALAKILQHNRTATQAALERLNALPVVTMVLEHQMRMAPYYEEHNVWIGPCPPSPSPPALPSPASVPDLSVFETRRISIGAHGQRAARSSPSPPGSPQRAAVVRDVFFKSRIAVLSILSQLFYVDDRVVGYALRDQRTLNILFAMLHEPDMRKFALSQLVKLMRTVPALASDSSAVPAASIAASSSVAMVGPVSASTPLNGSTAFVSQPPSPAETRSKGGAADEAPTRKSELTANAAELAAATAGTAAASFTADDEAHSTVEDNAAASTGPSALQPTSASSEGSETSGGAVGGGAVIAAEGAAVESGGGDDDNEPARLLQGLYYQYFQLLTFYQSKGLPKHFEIMLVLLDGIRRVVKINHGTQDHFLAVGAFIKLVNLLMVETRPERLPELCIEVLRTINVLIARNTKCKEFFRTTIGYDQLRRLIVTALDHDSRGVLEGQLLPLLVEMLVDAGLAGASGVPDGLHQNIQNADVISLLFELSPRLSPAHQADLFDTFHGLLVQSIYNQSLCCAHHLLFTLLSMVPSVQHDPPLLGKLLELVKVLGTHSITVRELKRLFGLLKSEKGDFRPRASPPLLRALQYMALSVNSGPQIFFDFDGKDSGLQLPVITKWPSNKGYSFTTWLRVESFEDPMNVPKFHPRLYSFLTADGHGFEAYFTKCTLVVQTIAPNSKKHQAMFKEVPFEEKRWYFVAITHANNKFQNSEIKLYVDGHMRQKLPLKYPLFNDPLVHCTLGTNVEIQTSTYQLYRATPFYGQMGAIYFFDDVLTGSMIQGIYSLGPNYVATFQPTDAGPVSVASAKVSGLLDGTLSTKVFLSFNCKAREANVYLDNTPQGNRPTPCHARAIGSLNSCVTRDVRDMIHSLGGVRILLPLFPQLNQPFAPLRPEDPIDYSTNPELATLVMSLVRDLLNLHHINQADMLDCHGFALIGHSMQQVSPRYLSIGFLNVLQDLSHQLLIPELLDEFFLHTFFNFRMWVYSALEVQQELLHVLVVFFKNRREYFRGLFGVQDWLDVIRTFYWSTPEEDSFGKEPVVHPITKEVIGERPPPAGIRELRSCMFLLIQLLTENGITQPEVRSVVSFLLSLRDNVSQADALQFVQNLLLQKTPGFVDHLMVLGGPDVFVKLLESPSEPVRLASLKVLDLLLAAPRPIKKPRLFTGIFMALRTFPVSEETYRTLLGLLLGTCGTADSTRPLPSYMTAALARTSASPRRSGAPVARLSIDQPRPLTDAEHKPASKELSEEERELAEALMLAKTEDDIDPPAAQTLRTSQQYASATGDAQVPTAPAREMSIDSSVSSVSLGSFVEIQSSSESIPPSPSTPSLSTPSLTEVGSGTKPTIAHPEMVVVFLKLLLNSSIPIRIQALRELYQVLHNNAQNREVLVELFGWQGALLTLLTDRALGSTAAEASELTEVVVEICALLQLHAIRHHKGGWKLLERTMAYLHTFANRGILDDAAMMRAILRKVVSNMRTEVEAMRHGPLAVGATDLPLHVFDALHTRTAHVMTNMAHFICFVEEVVFYQIQLTLETLDRKLSSRRLLIDAAMTSAGSPATTTIGLSTSVSSVTSTPPGSPAAAAPQGTTVTTGVVLDDNGMWVDMGLARDLLEVLDGLDLLTVTNFQEQVGNKSSQLRAGGITRIALRLALHCVMYADTSICLEVVPKLRTILKRDIEKMGTLKADSESAKRLFYALSYLMRALRGFLKEPATPPASIAPISAGGVYHGGNLTAKAVVPLIKEVLRRVMPLLAATLRDREEVAIGEMAWVSDRGSSKDFIDNFSSPQWAVLCQHLEQGVGQTEAEDLAFANAAARYRRKLFRNLLQKSEREDKNDVACEKKLESDLNALNEQFVAPEEERRRQAAVARSEAARAIARQLLRLLRSLTNESGPWGGSEERQYWKLDKTENYCRMRLKLKRNYNFDSHAEAVPPQCADLNLIMLEIKRREKEAAGTGTALPAATVAAAMASSSVATPARSTSPSDGVEEPVRDLLKLTSSSGIKLISTNESHDRVDEDNDSSGAGGVGSDGGEEEKTVFTTYCELVSPMKITPGRLEITTRQLLFFEDREAQSEVTLSTFGQSPPPRDPNRAPKDRKWRLEQIKEMQLRRYLLRRSALELFMVDQTNFFLNFQTKERRDKVFNKIRNLAPNLVHSDNGSPEEIFRRSGLTRAWQQRQISNFEYLMALNTIAGRTYNDLTQYPVFPWVIADYDSPTLDLNNPNTYRDLSKPIGALNPARLKGFIERYETFDSEEIPKFHYGSHYSSAGIVLFFLIRMEPFTTLFLKLQDGKFDLADRMFDSIPQTWKNCLVSNTDVKELIPEFYSMPEFLTNQNNFFLGYKQNGAKLDDVGLPPWARTPEDFIRLNREALESEYVSAHLHEWIDLIFGYKQRGPEAVKAHNVFYYLTYEGAIDIDAVEDPAKRRAIIAQINEFGQTPTQLLTTPHPARLPPNEWTRALFANPAPWLRVVPISVSDAPLVYIGVPETNLPGIMSVAVADRIVTVDHSRMATVHAWFPTATSEETPFAFKPGSSANRRRVGIPFASDVTASPSLFAVTPDGKLLLSSGHWDNTIKVTVLESSKQLQSIVRHKDVVTCLALAADGRTLITGSKDTTLIVWELITKGVATYKVDEAPIHILYGHNDEISCVAVDLGLDVAVSGSRDGTCIIHTLRQGKYVRSIPAPPTAQPRQYGLTLVAISSKGKIVLYSQDDLVLRLYSINGKLLESRDAHERLSHMLITRDGDFLITGGEKKAVVVRRLYDLKVVHKFSVDSKVTSLAMTNNERHLLVGLANGTLLIITLDPTAIKPAAK